MYNKGPSYNNTKHKIKQKKNITLYKKKKQITKDQYLICIRV